MDAKNTFTLITSEQLQNIEASLTQITKQLSELQLHNKSEEAGQILTTKEAMAFLKISHLNTFKAFLKGKDIKPIGQDGPKRYLKSDFIKKIQY